MANQAPTTFDINTTKVLNSGYEIPVLGYGLYRTPADVAESVTIHALRSGYRHLDSARVYRNEQPCADAIRASGLKREDIFFTSKVPPNSLGYEQTKKSIESTFAQTGLDYIDLYLIHAPYGGKEGRLGAWDALVDAQKTGKIRSLGVSNYGVHHLDELEQHIKASGDGSKIDVGQWKFTPGYPVPTSWSGPRNAMLSLKPTAPSSEASEAKNLPSRKSVRSTARLGHRCYCAGACRSTDEGYVPLPKSVTPKRIEDNAKLYDFELDEEDMKMLGFPKSYVPCAWDPTTSGIED